MIDENDNNEIESRVDKLSLFIVLMMLLSVMLTLVAFANYEGQFRARQTRLTLLEVGCEYVRQHSNIAPKMDEMNGGCEIDAHFISNMVGSGGVIFYGDDDSRSLSIADSVVVGTLSIWEPIQPWTRKQKIAGFLFLASLVFLMVMIFVLSASTKSRRE